MIGIERADFGSLDELRAANRAAGGMFFEPAKVADDLETKLVTGRWVLVTRKFDGIRRVAVYEAQPDGLLSWRAQAADQDRALDVVAAIERGQARDPDKPGLTDVEPGW
jgi:hypothetical protein